MVKTFFVSLPDAINLVVCVLFKAIRNQDPLYGVGLAETHNLHVILGGTF